MMEGKRSQVVKVERLHRLEKWLKATNTKLSQVNGQRKYGGPPEVWVGPTPGARCEVFISQLSRDVYEDQLIPLFRSVGPLWEFRLMMNFSGQNRGFAYAKYGSPDIASNAIRLLDGYMLEPGLRLSVRHSTEKRHLRLEKLPAGTRQDDLLQVLCAFTEGVERVSLSVGPGIEGVSATVAFSSHTTASIAKKVLVEVFLKHFSLAILVHWQSLRLTLPQLKPSLSFLPHPQKPPRHVPSSPKCPTPTPTPPGFCRAVGGPTGLLCPSRPCTAAAPLSPVAHLHELCEMSGVGPPAYEFFYSHMGPNGSLCLTYKVCIPGVPTVYKGLVMILPGPTTGTVMEEARGAAAQQVLQRVSQLTP